MTERTQLMDGCRLRLPGGLLLPVGGNATFARRLADMVSEGFGREYDGQVERPARMGATRDGYIRSRWQDVASKLHSELPGTMVGPAPETLAN